jgi:hypothetical protein
MSSRAAESICGKSATCKHIVAIAEADCIIGVLLSSILPTERGTGKEESLDVDREEENFFLRPLKMNVIIIY